MDIITVLAWVIGEGGAGMVAYWIMQQPPFDKIVPEIKRYVAWALSGICGLGAFALLLWFGAEATPITPQEWVEAMFRVLFLAITGSQFTHARLELSRR